MTTAPPVPGALQRAVLQTAYGDASVLRPGTVPVAEPADGEVLVRVRAAGLDRGTWHLMTGLPRIARLALGLRAPRRQVPGLDVAGTVVAVGPGVTRFAVGDEVHGIAKGSWQEHAPALEAKLAPKPAGLTWEQAAVVPVSGLTALQAVDAAGVGEGSRVLVLGASGGVGSYAVQVAVARGAVVTGVCSAAKRDFVRSLGAAEALDHATEDPTDGSRQWDAVLDAGGHRSLRRLRGATTRTGTIVIIGSEGHGTWTGGIGRPIRGALLSPFVRQKIVMLMAKEDGRDLERLGPLLASGQVVPALDATYPLDEAPDAMRRLVAGEVRGKVAITVA